MSTTRKRERGTAALVLVDVVNQFDFDGSDALLRFARPAARAMAALKDAAREAGMPIVYVNDNFGRWRSDFRTIVRACRGPDAKGREVTERLAPTRTDYFVLKPLNSGFHGTALDILLRDLRVRTLVLAGFATDNCVLFTANDAYLRGYDLYVPRDCSAAESALRHRRALEIMARTTKAETRPWGRLDLRGLASGTVSALRAR